LCHLEVVEGKKKKEDKEPLEPQQQQRHETKKNKKKVTQTSLDTVCQISGPYRQK